MFQSVLDDKWCVPGRGSIRSIVRCAMPSHAASLVSFARGMHRNVTQLWLYSREVINRDADNSLLAEQCHGCPCMALQHTTQSLC